MVRNLRAVLVCIAMLALYSSASFAASWPEAPVPTQDVGATASTLFDQGQTDRHEWENWLAAQSGDRLNGASFWAAHRSRRDPPECDAAGGINQVWIGGCNEAHSLLSNPDRLRHSSPEYRIGWNSVAGRSPVAATPVEVASASAQPSTTSDGSGPAILVDGPIQTASSPATVPVDHLESATAVTNQTNVAANAAASQPIINISAPSEPASPFRISWLKLLTYSILGLLFVLGAVYLLARGGPSAEEQLHNVLLPDEIVVGTALQHRWYALVRRRNIAAVTSGRLILLQRRLFRGFEMVDMRWQDIKDAQLSVGWVSATVRLKYSANLSDTAMNEGNLRVIQTFGLVIDPAQAIYRECQAQEQSWREKRRVRSIEEMRAKAGGVQIATGIQLPPETREPIRITDNLTGKLSQARDMLAQGLITDSEYEAIKARLVQSI